MNHVSLSLPLSATALREGSEFLAKLSQLAEVIRAESSPVGALTYDVSIDTSKLQEQMAEGGEMEQAVIASLKVDHQTSLAADVETAEQATVITQETLPPVEYETIVIGVERNPEYAGELAAYDHAALTTAGWTDEALVDNEYLREVTETRAKAVAPGASAAPSPAPAPPAPAAPDATELDVDGLPWDERIHSKAAERKAATGKWKTRKNLPAGYKEQIEAELRAAAPAAPQATSPAPTPAATAIPPAPSAPSPAPAPAASGFPAFTAWMMTHIKAQTLDQTKLTLACQKVGLSNAAELSKHPEHCDAVKADLIATYKLAN